MKKTMLIAGGVALAVVATACGTSTPARPSAGSAVGSAANPTVSPTPSSTSQHATAPTPGTPPSTQAYLDCLSDPSTTLEFCQQFNPSPSPSPSPSPFVPEPVGIPTAPFVVGDCVVVTNDPRDSTTHIINGALCSDPHGYRVMNVTTGTGNTNYCRSVDPTFTTDDMVQFRSYSANRTYCILPTPGSTGHS